MVPPTIVPAIRRTPLETVISTLQGRRTSWEICGRCFVMLRKMTVVMSHTPGAVCKP